MLYIGFEPFPGPRTRYLNFTSIALFRGPLKKERGKIKMKKFLALTISAMMLLSCNIFAAEEGEDTALELNMAPATKATDTTYAVNGGVLYFDPSTGVLTGADVSVSGSITIPSTIAGVAVTSIRKEAFYDCKLMTAVTIPSSVTSIGDNAFHGCLVLNNVTVPNSVTSMGASVFSSCKALTNITLPSTLTTIPSQTFMSCIALTNISLPSSVTSIGDTAFSGCTKLSSVSMPNVKSIGKNAFNSCKALTTLDLSNITTLSANAFSGSGLTAAKLTNATSIGKEAFSSCLSLSSVTLSNSLKTIPASCFKGCTALTAITIPKGVTSIGTGAFKGCSKLTSLTVDSGNTAYVSKDGMLITTTGTLVMALPSVTSFTIPSNVTTIGANAFENSKITTITIPSSVKTIESAAFYFCSYLKEIKIESGCTSIGDSAFYYCGYADGAASVYLPASVTNIDTYAFVTGDDVQEVVVTVHAQQGSNVANFKDTAFAPNVVILYDYNPSSSSGETKLLGDVNGDTAIDAKDASVILSAVASGASLDIDVADVNKDKSIDAKDATLVLQKASGIISNF